MIKLKSYVIFSTLLLLAPVVNASTTGKISGKITDVKTGESLPGVNVIVAGTYLGAASDNDGRYVILNIQPGKYTLVVQMMGYKKVTVNEIRVSVGLTTTYDFELEERVIDSAEEVVITAERPLIQKDMTSSMSSVRAEEIDDLPVQSVGAVINLQAGVVDEGGLHIRGGRSGEVVHWVDGVDMTTVGGSRGVTIEKDIVQEVQVISGTFNAEYGRAMSGVINIVTKDGEPEFHGTLKTYGNTKLSNFGKYYILNDYQTEYNQQTAEYESTEDRFYYYRNPHLYDYHVEGQLRGPVPYTNNKMDFITNVRVNRGLGGWGRRWFTPQGLASDSALVRLGGNYSWSGFGKLSYKLSKSVKLQYTLFWDGYDNERGGSTYVPESGNLSHGYSLTNMIALNHVLSPNTYYEFKVAYDFDESKSYRYEDYHTVPNYLVRIDDPLEALVDPSLSPPEYAFYLYYNGLESFDPDSEEGAQLLEYMRNYGFQYSYIIDPNDSEGYIHPDSSNVDNVPYSQDRIGMSYNRSHDKSSFFSAKVDVTSQMTKMHLVKFGVDYKQSMLDRFSYSLIPKTTFGYQIVPFEPAIPDPSTTQYTKYRREPWDFSVYLQDKIEFKEMILNVGVRFDYFNSNSVVPADPRDPDIYFPFNEENIYRDWVDPDPEETADWSIQDWDEYKAGFEEYTPDERRAFMHQKVKGKYHLSPRFGVSYPITDKGVIHFSYGHFFQRPSYNEMYASPDFKIGRNQRASIGNADLNAERTIQYEIGLQQELSKHTGLRATVFYKDIRDWISTSPLITTDDIFLEYSKRINKDFANVRGMTIELDQRFSGRLGATVDYTYQIAEGINNAPEDAYSAIINNQQPRNYLIPMDYDLRQNLNAIVRYRKKGWLLSLIGSYRTGFPYTPSATKYASLGGNAFVGWRKNSETRPVITSVTLRLEKTFIVNNLQHEFFVYINNVFDQKGEIGVYDDTGTARYTTYLDVDQIQYDPARVGTANYYIDTNNRGMFQGPMSIDFGYSIRF
ncbi:TonB-dependent receptor [candidate division KSB1 bacterium]|nr:TonB-dependent receptor [candidate division KSB1 bacterium]